MNGPLVLIVDDSAPGARLMAELVGLAGGVAKVVRGGGEALETARQMRPALVLMDIRLPDGDGRDWARRIHACDGLAGVPVWACSAVSPDELLADAWDDPPFDAWIVKPFQVPQVLARLREYLEP
jgi:CheY-like chemotaxis protein